MPGIFGLISRKEPGSCRATLERMRGAMIQEPFYGGGTYVHEGLGLYAGWTCHKGSYSDGMPIFNEKRDVALILSGESFIAPAVLSRIKSEGHGLNGRGAAYLVHLYEEDPEKFFQEMNGWFNGLIVDLRKPALILFNDRFGIHRVYYREEREEFFFSSEAKSLLRVRPSLREIDPRGLGERFSCGCVLENRTLFRGLELLPGGSAWVFQHSTSPKRRSYFRPEEWEEGEALSRESFIEKLREVLGRIVPLYLGGGQPIGVSLTGGLDSRIIMAFIDPAVKVHCYTFGSEGRDSLDVRISRQVAQVCGQEHSVIRLGKEYLARFPKDAERTVLISDGGLDACGSYELYLNEKAREIAPVRLTGNWGSELLRGARGFKAGRPWRKVFDPAFYEHIEEATRTFSRISWAQDLTFSLFRQAPWHYYGRLSVEQSQLTQRTPYMDKEFAGLVYRARKQDRSSDGVSLNLISRVNPVLLKFRTDRGAGGDSGPLSSWFWRLLYETGFKAEYYCGHGMPRWLSRRDRTLKRVVPYDKLFLGKHKFHNFRKWFQEDLSGYVREMLLDPRTLGRAHLNRSAVGEMVEKHIRGDENYLNEINLIITAELIHRLFLDAPSNTGS